MNPFTTSREESEEENKTHVFKRPDVIWPPLPDDAPKPPILNKVVSQVGESCVGKAAIAAIAGGGFGLFCGLLFGGYSSAVDKAVELEGPASMKLRVGFREAARAMASYSKSFAMFGVVYSASECAIEKARAKHDLYNTMLAGCATGAIMTSQPRESIPPRARAIQMASACGGMALFSTAIDYYMEYSS